MQGQTPPPTAPSVSTLPPRPSGSGAGRLATVLGAAAIAVAVVAVALVFLVPGPTGAQGGTGSPPETLWAVVAWNGVLSRGSGAAFSTHLGLGQYEVTFDQILYGCTAAASLGTTATGTQDAGIAKVAIAPSPARTVNVTTFDANSTAIDASFHLVLTCPGGLSAVVAADGAFISGAGVYSTSAYGNGTYGVVFNQNVVACAYVVGLGTSSGGSAPAGYATSASLASVVDGVYVSTFNSAGFNVNQTFHLTVYC